MIGYTMVGTKDLEKAKRFYEPIFEELGQELCFSDDQVATWGKKSDESAPRFISGYPFDGNEATVGNGVMTALLVPNSAKIDRLFEIALKHGGSSEGEPGPRPQYSKGFYAAYLRDPDGNKIAFVSYEHQGEIASP